MLSVTHYYIHRLNNIWEYIVLYDIDDVYLISETMDLYWGLRKKEYVLDNFFIKRYIQLEDYFRRNIL